MRSSREVTPIDLVFGSRRYRRIFPDVYVDILQHRMLFRGTFYKMPVHKEIIGGLQKKKKPGWLNISALFE